MTQTVINKKDFRKKLIPRVSLGIYSIHQSYSFQCLISDADYMRKQFTI